MAFYHRIPVKYIRIIAALYFAGFGLLLFIVSFTNAGFRWDAASVFVCSITPLIFNRRIVDMVMGLLLSVISGYFVLACIFIWIVGYEEGTYMRTWEFALASLLAFFSFACALTLFYAGSRRQIKQAPSV